MIRYIQTDITLHCIALHYTAWHCITVHCIALHCITLHCITLHCIALHYIALHCITLHCITLHCNTLHCIALNYIVLHYIALHYIALHFIALHCIALHKRKTHSNQDSRCDITGVKGHTWGRKRTCGVLLFVNLLFPYLQSSYSHHNCLQLYFLLVKPSQTYIVHHFLLVGKISSSGDSTLLNIKH